MKRFLNTILAAAFILTASVFPVVNAADTSVPTTKAIGFEDRNEYAISGNGNITKSFTADTPGGSNVALNAKCTGNPGDLSTTVAIKAGKEYEVSAKVKPVAVGASAGRAVMRLILQQSSGYTTKTMKHSGTAESMSVGNWYTLSTVVSASNTQNGVFIFRFGDSNNNSGSEFIIDDVVITPKETKSYVVDMNFDNGDLTNTGTSATATASADYRVEWGSLSYVGRNSGKAIEIGGVYGGYKLINIQNVLLKPNTTYKITYDMQQTKGFAVGKAVRMAISRVGYHKRSDESAATRQLNKAVSDVYTIPDTSWHTVTHYINTSDINVFDEYGYCDLYFEFFSDSTCNNTVGGDTLKCQLDDFKVEEVNILNGADFANGQMPLTYASSTAAYNKEDKAIDVDVTATGSAADIMFGTGIEKNTDYVLTYDIKGTEGMKIQTLLDGFVSSIGTWASIGNVTLTSEWTAYSAAVNFAGSDPYTYPGLKFRPSEGTGSYKLANVRLVKKSDAAVYANAAGALNFGEDTIINFKDCTGTAPAAYALMIYAKDTSGDKVVYWSGQTTQKAVKYTVAAPEGTKLYATVVAMSADNDQSLSVETELGTVQLVKNLSANLELTIPDDVMGVANIENDNNERYITLYIAQYDVNGKLLDVTKSDRQVIPAGQSKQYKLTISLDDVSSDTHTIKFMAWDDNMMPYGTFDSYSEE